MQYKDFFCHLHGCPMALGKTLPFIGSEDGLGRSNALAGHISIHFCIPEKFFLRRVCAKCHSRNLTA